MSNCPVPVNSKCSISVDAGGERENSWIFITRDDLRRAEYEKERAEELSKQTTPAESTENPSETSEV